MKKLKLSETDKQALLKEFEEKLRDYNPMDNSELSFEKKMEVKTDEKMHILFTPQAYLRCKELVKTFSGEVGWNGIIQRKDENTFLVSDIMVYPQMVNGARTLDPTKNNEWEQKYEDVYELMRFQAHSHVNMSTVASTTDMENQKQMVKNMFRGIMLFQIWNKQGDINSFLYDIDKQLLYDRNDVVIDIINEGEFDTLGKFISDARKQVEDMKVVPLAPTYTPSLEHGKTETKGYYWKAPKDYALPENEKLKNPFYWKDGNGNEGWDN